MIESSIWPNVYKAERETGSTKMRELYSAMSEVSEAYFKINDRYIKVQKCLVESISQNIERLEMFSSRSGLRAKEKSIVSNVDTTITLRCYGSAEELQDIRELDNYQNLGLVETPKTLDNFSDEELREELEKRSKNNKIETQIKNGVRILNLDS